MIILRRIDLSGRTAPSDQHCADRLEAQDLLEAARKKRGPWKDDPIVHGIVEVATS